MSAADDHLGRLIARSRVVLTEVRPRPAAHFEQARLVPDWLVDDLSDPVEVAPEPGPGRAGPSGAAGEGRPAAATTAWDEATAGPGKVWPGPAVLLSRPGSGPAGETDPAAQSPAAGGAGERPTPGRSGGTAREVTGEGPASSAADGEGQQRGEPGRRSSPGRAHGRRGPGDAPDRRGRAEAPRPAAPEQDRGDHHPGGPGDGAGPGDLPKGPRPGSGPRPRPRPSLAAGPPAIEVRPARPAAVETRAAGAMATGAQAAAAPAGKAQATGGPAADRAEDPLDSWDQSARRRRAARGPSGPLPDRPPGPAGHPGLQAPWPEGRDRGTAAGAQPGLDPGAPGGTWPGGPRTAPDETGPGGRQPARGATEPGHQAPRARRRGRRAGPPTAAVSGPAADLSVPPTTPTVSVTIGRVEVRAVAPPTPPRRPRRQSPATMGLEEHQRARERQR